MGICENSNCGLEVSTLRGTVFESQQFQLCITCSEYVWRTGKMRSLEQVQKTELLRRRRKNKGKRCHNSNCRTTNVKNGNYGIKNDQFYCIPCAEYINKHGVERPKELIQRSKRLKKAEMGSPVCDNPNCGKTSNRLRSVEVDKKWLRLCSACYQRWNVKQELRSVEAIAYHDDVRERQKDKGTRCFNANCRKLLVTERGRYGDHNGKYYCPTCATYVNSHNGEERPEELVKARNRISKAKKRGMSTCGNSECGQTVKRVVGIEIEDHGWMQLCVTCYYYAKSHGTLRTGDMVEHASSVKVGRKEKGSCCHNANCRTTDLNCGAFGKLDGEYYCKQCAQYANSHRGESRPTRLVQMHRKPRQKCANPTCSTTSQFLEAAYIKDKGELKFCHGCMTYAKKHHEFRPTAVVEKTEKGRQTRTCHNANCSAVSPAGGRYSKTNGEYYCEACCRYLDKNGEERSKGLVEEQRLKHSRYMWQLSHPWENPDEE